MALSKVDLQSIVFRKEHWNKKEAQQWLRKNNLKSSRFRQTKNTYRFQQESPKKFVKGTYTTEYNKTPGIEGVFARLKRGRT